MNLLIDSLKRTDSFVHESDTEGSRCDWSKQYGSQCKYNATSGDDIWWNCIFTQIFLIYFQIIVANVYILLHFWTISRSLEPCSVTVWYIIETLKADLLKDKLVHVNNLTVLPDTHTHTRSIKNISSPNVLYWLEYDEWTCQVWLHLRNDLAITQTFSQQFCTAGREWQVPIWLPSSSAERKVFIIRHMSVTTLWGEHLEDKADNSGMQCSNLNSLNMKHRSKTLLLSLLP